MAYLSAMKVSEVMTSRRVLTLGEEDSVGLALQVMAWSGVRHLPVVHDGEVVGIVTDRDVALRMAEHGREKNARERVGDVMRSPVETIPPDAEVGEAAHRMAAKQIGCLPVVRGGRLVGMLTTTDIMVQHSTPLAEAAVPAHHLRAQEIMSRDTVTATGDEPCFDAVARMARRGVRHLPVVDEQMRVVGMFSEYDVRQALGGGLFVGADRIAPATLATFAVKSIMSQTPTTVNADAPVDRLVQLFVRQRIDAVPVVDRDQRLLGIISYVDLLAALAPGQDARRS